MGKGKMFQLLLSEKSFGVEFTKFSDSRKS